MRLGLWPLPPSVGHFLSQEASLRVHQRVEAAEAAAGAAAWGEGSSC